MTVQTTGPVFFPQGNRAHANVADISRFILKGSELGLQCMSVGTERVCQAECYSLKFEHYS